MEASARNLPGVRTSFITIDEAGNVSSTLSVYDILKYDTMVITKAAVANIEEVYR